MQESLLVTLRKALYPFLPPPQRSVLRIALLLDLQSQQCSNGACANYAYDLLKSASSGRWFVIGISIGNRASSVGFSFNRLTQIAR